MSNIVEHVQVHACHDVSEPGLNLTDDGPVQDRFGHNVACNWIGSITNVIIIRPSNIFSHELLQLYFQLAL